MCVTCWPIGGRLLWNLVQLPGWQQEAPHREETKSQKSSHNSHKSKEGLLNDGLAGFPGSLAKQFFFFHASSAAQANPHARIACTSCATSICDDTEPVPAGLPLHASTPGLPGGAPSNAWACRPKRRAQVFKSSPHHASKFDTCKCQNFLEEWGPDFLLL